MELNVALCNGLTMEIRGGNKAGSIVFFSVFKLRFMYN